MNNKRATIKEVALKSGVCRTTVSHAFSGKRPVSKEMKQHIFKVAEDLGYKPHYAAQILHSGKSKTIGVLVRDLVNQYNTLYLQTIEELVSKRGYRAYVCITGTEQDKIQKYLEGFVNGQADGVLVITSSVADDDIKKLADKGYPVVTPSRYIPSYEQLWSIPSGFANAFRRLLEHLYDLGHRQYCLVWHLPSHSTDRLKEVDDFIKSKNLSSNNFHKITGVHTVEQSSLAVKKTLLKNPEITAVVCANDMLAVGSVLAAKSLNIMIPEELTVTGFGNIPISRYGNPAVTTVNLPVEKIAEIAVEKLFDQIEGRNPNKSIKTLPDLELLIRGSSGPARTKQLELCAGNS